MDSPSAYGNSPLSDTAYLTLAARYSEVTRPDALFLDAMALEFSQQIRPWLRYKSFFWAIIVRKAIFLQRLADLISSEDITTVINLGCGMDGTYGDYASQQGLLWIDCDVSEIIAARVGLAKAISWPKHHRVEAIDFLNAREFEAQLARLAPDPAKTLIMTEGVVGYYSDDFVLKLAAIIGRHSRFWLVDSVTGLPKICVNWVWRFVFGFKSGLFHLTWNAKFRRNLLIDWKVTGESSVLQECKPLKRMPKFGEFFYRLTFLTPNFFLRLWYRQNLVFTLESKLYPP